MINKEKKHLVQHLTEVLKLYTFKVNERKRPHTQVCSKTLLISSFQSETVFKAWTGVKQRQCQQM